MISALVLENYKGHRETRIELGRITMLVGPNGAGKTSVLDAIQDLSRVVRTQPSKVFQAARSPRFIVRRGADAMRLAIEADVDGERLDVSLRADQVHEGAGEGAFVIQRGNAPPQTDEALTRLGDSPFWSFLAPTIRFRFDARTISQLSVTTDAKPRVGSRGADTATVLAMMKLEDDERFARIERALQRVVPHVRRVRPRREVVRDGEQPEVGYRLSFEFSGSNGVPAHCASEGTLIATALLTVLLGDDPPHLVLIDDLDQALHPAAQLELMRQIKDVVAMRPGVQVVATTHSPYILDELPPEDVCVFSLRNDGTVATRRLSEHPEAASMKGSLTTGQFWSLNQEQSWVVEAAAHPRPSVGPGAPNEGAR